MPMSVVNMALVGLGGAIGSVLRFVLSGATHRLLPAVLFPFGTLVVNVLGCLAIGWLGGMAETRQSLTPELRLFLLVGILGGFTTFSTFRYETLVLARDAGYLKATLNVGAQVVLGLGAALFGYGIARSL
jgi:CrcB protein